MKKKADDSQNPENAQMAGAGADPDVELEADANGRVAGRQQRIARAVPVATPPQKKLSFFGKTFRPTPSRRAPTYSAATAATIRSLMKLALKINCSDGALSPFGSRPTYDAGYADRAASLQPLQFMIEKVKRILGLGSPKTGNKLIISVEKLERRVALLENGRLEEYNVERNSSRNIVGSVYKGKVKNIEMGLKAMFVDIGFEKMRSSISGTPFPPRSIAASRKSIGRRIGGRKSGSRPRISRAFIPSVRT